METESVRRFAYLLFVIIASVLLCYLGIKYVLPAALPFLIAWCIAFAIRPVAVKLSHRLGARVRIVRPALTVLFALLLLVAVFAVSYLLLSQVWQILSSLGEGEQLRRLIDGFLLSDSIVDRLLSSLGTSVSELIYKLVDNAAGFLFNAVSAAAGSIPRIMLFAVITLISTVYFAIDLERVNRAVLSVLPNKIGTSLIKFKDGFLTAAAGYLRSYLFIFLITLALMLFGSGTAVPCSHFEIACRDTFSCSASCSCERPLFLRSIYNFSDNNLFPPFALSIIKWMVELYIHT